MTDNNLLAVEIILPSRQINSNDNGINASNAAKTQEVSPYRVAFYNAELNTGNTGFKKTKNGSK